LCAVTTRQSVGSPTTAKSAFSPLAASLREPDWPHSSSTNAVKMISVSFGLDLLAVNSSNALNIAATLPFVSQAPRP